MIIQIKRKTRAGVEYLMLLNTRYIVEIHPTENEKEVKPSTRIIYDRLNNQDNPAIIYTDESISSLKGKITKASKYQFE
jgi:hypothetical protein